MEPQTPITAPDQPKTPIVVNGPVADATPPRQRLPKRLLLFIAAVVVVVLLIIAGIALFHHTKPEGMIDNEEHTYEATVSITGDGFAPATLSIKPDTEVFFENHSKNVEGETGPAVTVLQSKAAAKQTSGFSSGHIAADSGYGYTFRQSGTYQFYNFDNPKQTVTVVVK